MLSGFLMTTAVASTWVVDGTSLPIHYGRRPVEHHIPCPEAPPDAPTLQGRTLDTLAVALVAYSKKQGTMTWGHASLRTLYCLDGELVDAEYEMYRLSNWNESILRSEHRKEAFAHDPWLSTQRGKKVLFRNLDAVDHGWFGDSQAENREIYEVWLEMDLRERNEVVLKVEAAWDAQLAQFRARAPLPERFHMIWNNCTSLFLEVLPKRFHGPNQGPVTPFAWVRRLEEDALAKVLHPSHYLVRRWRGQLPETTPRLRPVFRFHKELRRSDLPTLRASLEGAKPVIPLPLDGLGAAASLSSLQQGSENR